MNDHFNLAVDVLEGWLLDQFEDADLVEILENDPEGVQLLNEDFDKVLTIMKNLKLNIHLQ